MVKVKSSAGGFVEISVLGISEVMRRLQFMREQLKDNMDVGTMRAGTYVGIELQESIMGNRAEPRSVRTGLFGNSIVVEKVADHVFVVKSNPTSYPENPNVTTEDVAGFLEDDRMHFHNTKARTENEVQEIIKKEIKDGVQKF